jgi:sugar phosphate isomerase/epimerase
MSRTVPLAVQLYSVRDEFGRQPAEVLHKIAELGYAGVEPADPFADPAGVRRIVDELGMQVCATHAPVLDRLDEVVDAATTLGCVDVIVPVSAPERWADPDGVRALADEMSAAAEQLRTHALRLGYHNHEWELQVFADGRTGLEHLADHLDDVFLEVDIYWAYAGGAEVPDLLARLAERVQFLHLKDGPGTRPGPMTALGQGVIPVEQAMAADAPRWHVVELDSCASDIFDALAESRSFVDRHRTAGAGRP